MKVSTTLTTCASLLGLLTLPLTAAASELDPQPFTTAEFLTVGLKARQQAPSTSEVETPKPMHSPRAITDLRTQLAGTTWKAASDKPLRGGLAAVLSFNANAIEPAGYRYDITPHDYTVRILFNHGDTQLMFLTDEGKRLRFTFGGRDYSYELVPK